MAGILLTLRETIMAKAHVLESRPDGYARVVFHITTPSGNNVAGIPWRDALKNSGLAGTTRLATGNGQNGTITTAEANDVANGVVYETEDWLPVPPNVTGAEANAFLDEHHAAKAVEVVPLLQTQLRFFGYTRA